jgi:aspartate/methionine/tyrosine aminotransferase
MTYAATRYLGWARQFFGKVPYDLATSGIPTVTKEELGAPPDLDDLAGIERFAASIAKYNDVPRAEAVPALGTSHALWLAYATLLAPGDDVLVEDPAYEPLLRAAEGVGARAVRFARDAARGWALDPDRVARAITPRTRVVAITNHHNPTGVRTPDDVLVAVAAICQARGAHLLVDEVYAPFDALVDEGGVFRGSARKLAPNVVAVASLTKCYGLGPHRIGWLLGPADVVARAGDVITATVGHLPLQHANLGAHAFDRIQALAARARAQLAGRREQVAAWMATRPDLAWSAPKDGLFGLATSTRAGELLPTLEAAARDHGVLVAAGTFFGVPNGFRLSWASLGEAALAEALTRLGRVLPSGP